MRLLFVRATRAPSFHGASVSNRHKREPPHGARKLSLLFLIPATTSQPKNKHRISHQLLRQRTFKLTAFHLEKADNDKIMTNNMPSFNGFQLRNCEFS